MTEQVPPENINIYLHNKSEKEKVLKDATPQERYIILMNDTLQVSCREKTDRIRDLETQIEELETDSDRLEKGRTYMKGLLQNFIAVDKWNSEIREKEAKMLSKTKDIYTEYKKRTRFHLRIFQALIIVFLGISYEYYPLTHFIPFFLYTIIISIFQESSIQGLLLPNYSDDDNKIKELLKEIKKVEKAQDFLSEYIDQQ